MKRLHEIKAEIDALSDWVFAEIRRWVMETDREETEEALAASLERGHGDPKARRGWFV